MRIALLGVAFAAGASAFAMSVQPPTFAELVDKANAIVDVTVESTRCQWDTTPTGDRVIHTYVDCRVHDVVKGTAGEHLELRFLGGSVGRDRLVIADMPKFEVGSEYVLFVAGNGEAFCPLVHVMHGSYRVLTDATTGERRIARHNREPLHASADVSRPYSIETFAPDTSGMTAAQFRAAIVAQLKGTGESHVR
jgi:hypothetical protein